MIQIRISGWAGQGVMLAGTILAHTFSEVLKKNVLMTRSYTAAVRSGVTTSDVLVDDSEIYDLTTTSPDVMILMDQRALNSAIELIKKSGTVIVDSTVIKEVPIELKAVHRIAASQIAEEISSPKMSNMVLLGSYARITGSVTIEELKETVQKYVPEKFVEADLEAIKTGFDIPA